MIKKRKLLLIGWDSADWKIINKLIEKKQMPALEKLMKGGVSGNISTLDPPFSPMLWTTIATGVYPDKHGIMGFVEPLPDKIGIRHVSSASRKVKALWNMFTQKDLKSHIVGWWPSNPVEPINGTMISDFYQKAGTEYKDWKLPENTVHPENMRDLYGNLRVHYSQLTDAHLLPFVPHAKEVDQKKDERLYRIAKSIAEAASLQSATTYILDNEEWDFVGLYLDTIDHVCHGFMNYYPPKMPTISDEEYHLYKDVVDSIYRFHDMMLDELIKLAGDDATVMLVSDHGFISDHLRIKVMPDEPASPALQHREHGIFIVNGPGIKKGEKIYGASLIDIAPTVLSLFNQPIGEDMPGRPLVDIYNKMPDLKYIPSWEDVQGYDGMLNQAIEEDLNATQEGLKQLVELGYIEEPGEDEQESVDLVIRENNFSLARVYMGTGRFIEAIPVLEKIHNDYPKESRFCLRLIATNVQLGKMIEALDIAENHLPIIDEVKIKLDEEITKLKDVNFEKDEESEKLFYKKVRQFRECNHNIYRINLLKVDILLKLERTDDAFKILKDLERKLPNQRSVLNQMGNAYLQLGELKDAKQSFKNLLKQDSNDHTGYYGLSRVYLLESNYELAIDNALKATDLFYNYPIAHLHLGIALLNTEHYNEAVKAFEVTLNLAPGMGKARNYLINIYEDVLNKPELANKHKNYFKQNLSNKTVSEIKNNISVPNNDGPFINLIDPVTVVSGLPRSGTSMMMQMLDKGGLDIFSDGVRKPDENNPKGYYEHEAVKRLVHEKMWLVQAKNKVVKVISHLLPHLPEKHTYKIIFMERDIDEIVRSQHVMLERNGKVKKGTYLTDVDLAYNQNLDKIEAWAKDYHNIDILHVHYENVINDPGTEAKRIQKFLNKELDINKMIEAVDKKLYRTKI